jgi:hypothetical protein
MCLERAIPSGSWLQGALIAASLAAAVADVSRTHTELVDVASLVLALARATYLGGVEGFVGAFAVSALLALPYLLLFFWPAAGPATRS